MGYLAVSPFCHKFLEKYDGTLLCVISFYMISIGSFLGGPSWLCRSFLDDSLPWIISGLLLTGLFTSFTTIGTYNEMYLPFVELHGGEPDGKIKYFTTKINLETSSLGFTMVPTRWV